MNTLRILRHIPFLGMDQADLGATSATTNGGLQETDVLLIAGVIAKRQVCVDCLRRDRPSLKSTKPSRASEVPLEVIREVALCDHCLKQTVVHRLGG